VKEILASYLRPELDPAMEAELHSYVLTLAKKAGMQNLPMLEDFQPA